MVGDDEGVADAEGEGEQASGLVITDGAEQDPAEFHSVFLTHDEWAAEMANSTMHCVLHLGWVPDGKGGYHGVMTVLVKANGLLGRLYMLAIKPFRYVGVYPALLRSIGRRWEASGSGRHPAGAA